MTRPPAPARDRYWLCDDRCTTDCGICKGAGRPPALTVLDELDELRAKATPGPWIEWRAPDVTAIGTGFAMLHGVPSNPSGWIVSGDSGLMSADAALIVAAVNAVPKLTAALRAVLAVLDDAEARNERSSFRFHDGSKRRPDVQVDAIRAAITTALEASR